MLKLCFYALILASTLVFPIDISCAETLSTQIQASSSTSTPKGIWASWKENLQYTWQSDKFDLYVPLYTWHNRAFYSAEKIASYNEQPWGMGLGKYHFDRSGNRHSLYTMAFADSHSEVQLIAGYGYEKVWHAEEGGWRVGLGGTLGLTARGDDRYIPIPFVLPLVSVEKDRLSLQATYVPGGKNFGNILFLWLRWQL